MKFTNRKILLVILLVIFVFLRLFVASHYLKIAGDSSKFLKLVKQFPYHRLSNDQLYLLHAPLYPYFIHFFQIMVDKDYLAAISINLISAIVTFFVLYKFLMLLTNSFFRTYIVLALFTFSVEFVNNSQIVLRESFIVMLLITSIYFYVRGVKLNEKISIFVAALLGATLGLATDHVVFLFPAFGLSYLFFNNKKIYIRKFQFPNLKYALIPVIITLISYGSWLGVRYYEYSTNEYYPLGLEGTPIKTANFGFIELMNPTYFDTFESGVGVKTTSFLSILKKYSYNLGYMINMQPFSIPRGLNFTTVKFLLHPHHIIYMLLIYLPMALIAAYGFFSIIKLIVQKGKLHNNVELYFLALFSMFLFPLTQKVVSPRYIHTAYFFMYTIIAYGLIKLIKNSKFLTTHKKSLIKVVIAAMLLMPIIYYYSNPYFTFSMVKSVGAQNAAEFINQNIKKTDAIMSQPGYTYKLLYLTDNRIISLPANAKDVMPYIQRFNISYIIFGRYYTFDRYRYSVDSAGYIKSHPEKFKLIAAIQEDYSKFYSPEDEASSDEEYIYKVIS